LRRSARGANSPLPAARSAMDRTSQMPFAWSSLLGPDPWAGLSWRRHFTPNHPLSERLAQQGSPFLPVYLGLTVPPRSTGWDRGALSSDRLREPLEMSQFRTPGVMFKQCALESPVPALTWTGSSLTAEFGCTCDFTFYPPPDHSAIWAAYRRNGRTYEPGTQLDAFDGDGRMLDSAARICSEFYLHSE